MKNLNEAELLLEIHQTMQEIKELEIRHKEENKRSARNIILLLVFLVSFVVSGKFLT
ncbi:MULTISPECIES: hypothetical protein [unclassified Helicobacter]|uniref:hypothetical protein n=1 Tax=unclassified Helicobacter TaxID=2593540 RepID=UPI0015F1B2B6|nr:MULTISPECIES: hypothetical protein [unclassified Helicobacter]